LRAKVGCLSIPLVLASACTTTERAIFEPIAPREPMFVSAPPIERPRKARSVDEDAGGYVVPVIRDEDAGMGPDPGLDPSAVFSWTESLPGQGTCKAGRYVGKFTCTIYDSGNPDPQDTLSGSIFVTLVGSPEEPIRTIKPGQISGPFFASGISGMLDCSKQAFTAMTLGGRALLADAGQGMAAPTLFPTFGATLDGHFDSHTLVIEGSFKMVNDTGQTCDGDFRVSATP
jgi:hypothetical protein